MHVERQRLGWLAIFGALCGFIGFGLLVAALAAPTPSPDTLRRSEDLFRWQDGGVFLQALTMVPLTLALHALTASDKGALRQPLALMGLAAQLALVLVLLLRFANKTSDMLYMIPQGLVGLWLVLFCASTAAWMSRVTRWVGYIGGIGLIVIGTGALTYGILVAPTMFVRPLTDAEIDAQIWTLPNIVAHICLAAGALTGRTLYPIWLLLAGRLLLRRE